ncbi:hypothetical protein TeGR_g4785 [Tetraparma gracilis]|uniref:Uncharacterized protein n=1 Tax=Tetraparma gracilis TaxID=2962635 RepID=A0ABQ6MGH6_9STRA|nr:hypothetical protein TeGR_g4785 [Tetraparma gracilis]
MPNFSKWTRQISEGSEELRAGVLKGIAMQLEACEDMMDDESWLHALLVEEKEFLAALVSLASDSSAVGAAAVFVLTRLAVPEMNQLPLFQFPGLLDALIATLHVDRALATLTWLSKVKDEAQQVAMAINTALVDLLVANVGRVNNACVALFWLCYRVDNNRALLYEHPGLIAAVADATRVPACANWAVSVLTNMTASRPLRMSMLRNSLVLDALRRAAGSDIDKVSNCAIDCLYNLSIESENHALMRDDVRVLDALTARMDHQRSKNALFRICYIGDLPNPLLTLDLPLVCSRPFHHQLSLCKALIREHPEQLSAKDSSDRTPLKLAREAHLPAPVINLVRDCAMATAAEFSLTHLVGYSHSQRALARAQCYALMCSLKRAAKEPAQVALVDPPGALNPVDAVQAYRAGGIDPWSVIGRFAY